VTDLVRGVVRIARNLFGPVAADKSQDPTAGVSAR
jgi:hypothetical protein